MVKYFCFMEKQFGAWLSDEIQKRGISQIQLARKAEITPAQISRLISGSRGAGEKTLNAIAKGLDLPPEIVFRAAGFLPPKKKSSSDFDELVFLIEQLSPSERQEIEELVRFKIERKRVGGKAKPTLSVLKEKVEH
jgi:transcriptional regulator with XRE-family HTH domain